MQKRLWAYFFTFCFLRFWILHNENFLPLNTDATIGLILRKVFDIIFYPFAIVLDLTIISLYVGIGLLVQTVIFFCKISLILVNSTPIFFDYFESCFTSSFRSEIVGTKAIQLVIYFMNITHHQQLDPLHDISQKPQKSQIIMYLSLFLEIMIIINFFYYMWSQRIYYYHIPKETENEEEEAIKADTTTDTTEQCSVCMDNLKSCAFVPCGHMCVCISCSQNIKNGKLQTRCFVCNQESTGVYKIFT